MKVLSLFLIAVLCVSCVKGRQEPAGGGEAPSAPGLIQTDAREEPRGDQAESSASLPQAESGQQLSLAGTEASEAAAGKESAQTAEAAVRSIAALDLAAARIEPSCYLEGRDSFLSKSYHDASVLYLVGFSADGKIAFIRQEELDGKGGTDLYFVVQDLVSDELLWELQAPTDESYWLGKDLMTLFLSDNQALIDGKLASYGISIVTCPYERFPYKAADGRTFEARIESVDTGKLMYDMFSIIRYSCAVTDGKGRTKKVIADKEIAASEAFVCGCLKNPFENRLALVIAEAVYGFEGCDMKDRFAGCDMQKGF